MIIPTFPKRGGKVVAQPLNHNMPKAMNIRTRLTENLNLSSETGNIYLITNSINRFRIDASGNVDSYGASDVSGNIKGLDIYEKKISLITKYAANANFNFKQNIITCKSPLLKDVSNNITIDLSACTLKNRLNQSNVTSGTLPVFFNGIGTTT